MSRVTLTLCTIALMAVTAFGCGDSSGETSSGTTPATDPKPVSDGESAEKDRPKKGAWGVAFGAEGEELGLILYDLSGHTLYTFENDKGSTSTCYGACAETWPPALTEDKAKAGGSAMQAKVGTTKRRDGTVQLTYAGHPLYTYSRDKSAEVKGNGIESFGGEWYAIRPNGEKP
jgi:predicted lipoprotein with Yx(FWY)xxD motif